MIGICSRIFAVLVITILVDHRQFGIEAHPAENSTPIEIKSFNVTSTPTERYVQ